MKQTTVKDNQSWFDLALQITGTIENLFDLFGATDAIDTMPTVGRIVKTNEIDTADNLVVNYYASNAITPATWLSSIYATGDGIGYWIIENDFIVQ